MSIDPMTFMSTGSPDYFNRYSYTANDPINRIDPDGEFWGVASKVVKVAIKGGDVASVLAGAKQDIGTLTSSDASGWQKLGAAASLATEVFSPVSARDAKAGASFVKNSVCFEAGTLILTNDGKQTIETIKVGDVVWSSDPETGQSGWKTVSNTFINDESSVWELTFADNEKQATVLHRVTGEHPYWVQLDGEWSWRTVSELREGMVVETKSGKLLNVIGAYDTNIVKRTYNFEVEDFHTYYVGEEEILVHNACKKRTANDPIRRENGHRVPDPEAEGRAHTQLGTMTSKRTGEKYNQAVEFDKNGKVVSEIDFTDHKMPSNHPNPHRHTFDPDTGKKGPPEPLE